MINIDKKLCGHTKCKENALFGISSTSRPQYCAEHKAEGMINLVLWRKCSVPECDAEHDVQCDDGNQYCLNHCPSDKVEIAMKRLCKYCDIKENSPFVCKDCQRVQNKKEWGVVRHIKANVRTPFEYNSSKMLQGCSKKRPDVYFEKPGHCVIVEVDENQHRGYEDSCECSRLNEIVNGIGGKPVVIIRFNPDVTRHQGKQLPMQMGDKVDLLIDTIKEELDKEHSAFSVKLIQLYYNDCATEYSPKREEDITSIVCV
jgi:hypothetical protein